MQAPRSRRHREIHVSVSTPRSTAQLETGGVNQRERRLAGERGDLDRAVPRHEPHALSIGSEERLPRRVGARQWAGGELIALSEPQLRPLVTGANVHEA